MRNTPQHTPRPTADRPRRQTNRSEADANLGMAQHAQTLARTDPRPHNTHPNMRGAALISTDEDPCVGIMAGVLCVLRLLGAVAAVVVGVGLVIGISWGLAWLRRHGWA
jgi:hypothetical protein